jgi:hypothetical protein
MGGEKNRGKGEGMEGERREEKSGEGMDAPGAGPPKIFGLEPPLGNIRSSRKRESLSLFRRVVDQILDSLRRKVLVKKGTCSFGREDRVEF